MERYGGSFGAYDDAEPLGHDDGSHFDEPSAEVPPSPVGQDERRMQVRAYNHWAALIGDGQFPDIADLALETLDDFGPYGVLLDFSGKRGIDDPAIRFIGDKLAQECGGDGKYKRLSDVPGRSLLSRITDHYLQILANKAPIGFEAEFTNDRGASVLYRGILLPWSRDGETIDFIFGVINWKEMADAATADALLSAIDAALEAPTPPHEGTAMDRTLDLSGFAATESASDDQPVPLPMPAFGAAGAAPALHTGHEISSPLDLVDEVADEDEGDYDEDAGEPTEWGSGFSGFGDEDSVYTVDYGDQGLEDGEEDEDFEGVVDPLADDTASLGLASLVARSGRVKQSVALPGMDDQVQQPQRAEATAAAGAAETVLPVARTTLEQRLRAAIPHGYGAGEFPSPLAGSGYAAGLPAEAEEPLRLDAGYAEDTAPADADDAVFDLADEMIELAPEAPAAPVFVEDEPEGLYDCLAAARELAQTARSSEDRGRKALYQAVGRAYDFSLEAAANPVDFADLLAENGLTVQDRAPMTPIVKLVFGADYDKTRLTEYATVLGFAHRTGVVRGGLDQVLARAEGGLKGIVVAERKARKADGSDTAEAPRGIRKALARKLGRLDAIAFEDLAEEGPEFALVMVRRLPSGELVVLGEVPEDVPLVEKAARKLIG